MHTTHTHAFCFISIFFILLIRTRFLWDAGKGLPRSCQFELKLGMFKIIYLFSFIQFQFFVILYLKIVQLSVIIAYLCVFKDHEWPSIYWMTSKLVRAFLSFNVFLARRGLSTTKYVLGWPSHKQVVSLKYSDLILQHEWILCHLIILQLYCLLKIFDKL